MLKNILTFCASIIFLQSGFLFAQENSSEILKEGLLLKLGRGFSGNIISPDVITSSLITDQWETPSEGEEVSIGDSTATWEVFTSDENGWYRGRELLNSYLYFNYKSDKDKYILLESMANQISYVNGVPRAGNPYRYRDDFDPWGPRFDYSLIPVKVNKGNNDLLFKCRRGLFKVKINPVEEGLRFNPLDLTIPDLVVNESSDTYGAMPIINVSENSFENLTVKTTIGGNESVTFPVKQVHPLSILKVPFKIKCDAISETGTVNLTVQLIRDDEELASTTIELRIVNLDDKRRETFISGLDGSVQYYAITPPKKLLYEKPALFLSLHGAGVEALNQAQAYDHKNWGYLVAPTNRRPYGFNWENWGMYDALEVLDIAKNKFSINEDRVYLTGHSMGGHGTWQVGLNHSDKFAAIGPSAGWISIWSYRIRPRLDSTSVEEMLIRSSLQSDTYAYTTNLKNTGIYILHGDEDDNVPPEQSRSMVENLSKFHKDFIYHEEEGVGHWWDNSEEPGADCVDWKPMFDFFAYHSVPGKYRVANVDFVTSNPAVSSRNNWAEIINQFQQQKMSKIDITLERGNRKFVGTTDNVLRLAIDVSMLSQDEPISIELDDQLLSDVEFPADNYVNLTKMDNNWQVAGEIDKTNKYPARCGNIREVLNHNVLFVYGTNGNDDENKWAYQKARYDAERLWYQGNASIEIIADEEFDPLNYKDRSVVLFGNSETNSAWDFLFDQSPVQMDDQSVTIGQNSYEGDDLALLMIRPRKDSDIANVAVVGGTGLKGMRLSGLAMYYQQYTGLPDIVIFDNDIVKSDSDGVKFSGYFGNDWSLENGEFVGSW